MLFNSFIFLTLFLPPAIAGYYLLGTRMPRLASLWLCVASLLFYGWWNPSFLSLLLLSILFNYGMSCLIMRAPAKSTMRRWCLAIAITVDLLVLIRYKYLATLLTFLFADSGVSQEWLQSGMTAVVLPLGVSFFTFTQIGYLLDCNSGIVKERKFLDYVQFVTFFPHLIAGPILHHKEMMTQFAQPATYRFKAENFSIGATIFVIGLAKKVLLADSIAPYADAGFAAADSLQTLAAWGTCMAYAFQLYFDFSGYSDMAMGLAKMFGIRFPLNFNSPFKANSIIEFWQRWHMTLTRYLTAYLYYPLSMRVNRWRAARGLPIGRVAQGSVNGFGMTVAVPTFYTLTLAGVWHGAGWQFLFYGLLHASFLTINHGYRALRAGKSPAVMQTGQTVKRVDWKTRLEHGAGVLLTWIAVLIAFAFFRADGMDEALNLLKGMAGLRGIEQLAWPELAEVGGQIGTWLHLISGRSVSAIAIVLFLWIVWCMPNSHQIMGRHSPALDRPASDTPRWAIWYPGWRWGLGTAFLFLICLAVLHREARFLYFQF